jgi:glutamyl-tRNA synthetase
MSNIRVRMAPSPTGFFHIGNAKAALINWLIARKMGGTFLLRLEDTDTERSDESYADVIYEALQWLGIDWDEGPVPGGGDNGDYGPYRQSERRDIHVSAAQRLLDEGKAYKCFCTREELDAEREKARAEKRPPRYSRKCRDLSADEVAAKGDARYAVRFKVEPGETLIHDLIQGDVTTNNAEFDDFIVVKPNGDPIFHLAVVVDDGEMKISHVVRGDDHFTNAFKHVLLFQALGYDVPTFAHMPMVLDERGKKYSKRLHGANVLDWREDGYLPDALVNYLVLLGWTPGDDTELFSRDELVAAFTVDRLGKSPGKFDLKKLQWLNGQHMRRMTVTELRDRIAPIMREAGLDVDSKSDDWQLRLAEICQEKLRTLNEIVAYSDFFFALPAEYEEKAVRKQWQKDGALDRMESLRAAMAGVGDWSAETLKEAFGVLVEQSGDSLGKFIHPSRLGLTGKSIGPGLFELAELLGREESLTRMDRAVDYVRGLEGAQA